MKPLPHAYTNTTTGNGAVVRKVYQGPDSAGRCRREAAALNALPDLLPVPRPVSVDAGELQMTFLAGRQGQELFTDGHAVGVLRACGQMLQRIHRVDLDTVCANSHPPGSVLVHGDYGPNNVLLDPDARQVTAVLDWEWWSTSGVH